ncbi:Dabb family protein [Paraflavitalea pollutisoli]|uniref:Dabb family protein n=1 Tax=Paraflavitalea pollutisoli TaxID=3034143 RepID=UPI0023EE257D|nr:Dabb family protein [Paraflavitalea sp. H1-2-19X]
MSTTRREFIASTGKAVVAGGLITLAENNQTDMADNKFIHHVYFWLKNPESKEDKAKLIAGLKKLAAVKTISWFHIGQPANTHREVIDSSYSISWCLMFNNDADQASYQTDPIHLKFIDECSSLWSKVTVYDSVDAK